MPETGAEARWSALIREFRAGGETITEFCRRRGISKPSFYHWRRRLRQAAAPARSVPFLPVHVADTRPPEPPRGSGVEILLRGGRRLRLERGFDPEVLTAALAALEAAPC